MPTRIIFEVDGKLKTSIAITDTTSLGCDGIVRSGSSQFSHPKVSVLGTAENAKTLQRICFSNNLKLEVIEKVSFQSQSWANTPHFIGV